MAGYAVAEFDADGRTYKIRLDNWVAFDPYFFVNQMRDSVGQYEDLYTGTRITVNWQQIAVIRILEISKA